eukprot:TRINITY_DN3017_c0_g1_i12.p1 TRINITY_DN3017_c0_g1~~TRINITY_DN3017_c0_g1_i12.p1  ORF type:complete len:352 (-),score=66.65 TRINITY_DN3017_c0_g1_i12:633-1688(-)
MVDGDSIPIQGDSGASYEIRFRGGIYYCTCTAWKMQNTGVDKRTCKHLRTYLGEEFETYRVGRTGNAPVKVKKVQQPALLLAQKWTPDVNPTGWWISEKLDGVRAYWNGKEFISRLGNVFFSPDWFNNAMPPDLHLDGELFLSRGKFNDTISIVKSQDESERWKQLVYHVFDVISYKEKPFEERMALLNQRYPSNGSHNFLTIVKQIKCQGVEHLKQQLERVERKGGEGIMLRQPKSKYVGTRSSTLLKLKNFFDDEAKVVGHLPGKGKHLGRLGALQCELANKKLFQVGTGFSDAQREKPPKIGSIITFRYQELTPGGIPRFPSFVGERIDVAWPPPPNSKPRSATGTAN